MQINSNCQTLLCAIPKFRHNQTINLILCVVESSPNSAHSEDILIYKMLKPLSFSTTFIKKSCIFTYSTNKIRERKKFQTS